MQSLFFFLYSALAFCIYLLSLPFVLFFSRRQKYKRSLPARFFLADNPPLQSCKCWFHGCSLGEIASLGTLLKEFDSFGLTTTTQTGFDKAKSFTANTRYLPFEPLLFFWMRRHDTLVVLEAELWYLLFALAKKKGTKTVLLSARINDKSYSSYKKMRFFYKRIFANIDVVFAQSRVDKQRLEALGAKNVKISGNIKLSNLPRVSKTYEKPKQLLITAGSTHEGEEALALEAFLQLPQKAKLIIVPRHPERFEAVDAYLRQNRGGKSYHRFSQRADFDSDIVLVDVMGELNNIYAISDIVVLAGSFAKIGGHNPIEPGYFGCKIISGEHFFNQHQSYKAVENIKVTDDLTATLQAHEKIQNSRLQGSFDLQSVTEEIKHAGI
ncbi:MAG: lipid IV(A) 3-deoxy-D-manno-octulosonic acid transferase [Campylobacterota bacterium]